MKNIKLLLVSMLAAVFSGCMDHHDDPTNYTYGNPAVGEANTTIADLKTKYAGIVSSNKAEEVQENLVISGVVVGRKRYLSCGHKRHRTVCFLTCRPENSHQL